jgi:hypothetical protein
VGQVDPRGMLPQEVQSAPDPSCLRMKAGREASQASRSAGSSDAIELERKEWTSPARRSGPDASASRNSSGHRGQKDDGSESVCKGVFAKRAIPARSPATTHSRDRSIPSLKFETPGQGQAPDVHPGAECRTGTAPAARAGQDRPPVSAARSSTRSAPGSGWAGTRGGSRGSPGGNRRTPRSAAPPRSSRAEGRRRASNPEEEREPRHVQRGSSREVGLGKFPPRRGVPRAHLSPIIHPDRRKKKGTAVWHTTSMAQAGRPQRSECLEW